MSELRAWLIAAMVCAAALASQPCAAGAGPRLPCRASPLPAYAAPGAPPNVRAWLGDAARGWTPPPCTGWAAADADIIVALAGSFRFDGGFADLLARIGAISATQGVRYWSTTDKAWQPLVTEAYALSGPPPSQRRPDFAPAQFVAGRSLYYAQSDNRSSDATVYRMRILEAAAERLVVATENVTPMTTALAMVTMFDPGAMQTVYVVERGPPGVWTFYSVTRTHMASSLLPIGSEASYINRAAAFYRHVAGIRADLEPPAAR